MYCDNIQDRIGYAIYTIESKGQIFFPSFICNQPRIVYVKMLRWLAGNEPGTNERPSLSTRYMELAVTPFRNKYNVPKFDFLGNKHVIWQKNMCPNDFRRMADFRRCRSNLHQKCIWRRMVSNTSIFLTQVNKYLGLTRSSSQPLFPKNTIPTKRSNSALSTLLGTNTGTITAGTIIGWYVSIRPYCHQINQIKTEIFLTPSCRRFQAAYFIKNFLR